VGLKKDRRIHAMQKHVGEKDGKVSLHDCLLDNEEDDASVIKKIPPLTVIYWCEKMAATTFGESFSDFWTQTEDYGYSKTSVVLVAIFFVSLAFQLKVKTYWPILFWLVMSTSSIAGTCISDFIDRTLKWGCKQNIVV
jgi:uncharacterized membrane-anchored protein